MSKLLAFFVALDAYNWDDEYALAILKNCHRGYEKGWIAFTLARRGMRLNEKMHGFITAYLSVKDGKHVWSQWSQLNKILKSRIAIKSRHSFYSISNWELVVKEPELQSDGTKRKRASS